MPAANSLSRVVQISMRVLDLERAIRFYRDSLGLTFLFPVPPRMAFFDCGGTRLMLALPEEGFDHPGSILYFGVEDIHAMHVELCSRGVTFRSTPHKIGALADREIWLADFEDTEGNTLALMSEPPIER